MPITLVHRAFCEGQWIFDSRARIFVEFGVPDSHHEINNLPNNIDHLKCYGFKSEEDSLSVGLYVRLYSPIPFLR